MYVDEVQYIGTVFTIAMDVYPVYAAFTSSTYHGACIHMCTYADPTAEGVLNEKEFLDLYRQHRPAPIPEREHVYAKAVTCLRFISVFQVRWLSTATCTV